MHFSIILPTIGRDSLQNAINSVLAQTYQDWHLYIVCDGWVPSRELLIKQQESGNKITIIHVDGPHNDSGAFARNYGIRISGSSILINTLDDEISDIPNDWLTFLDCDDEYLPTALETVAKIASMSEANMIKTCGQMFKMGHKHSRSSQKIRKYGQINTLDVMTIGIACKRSLFNLTKGWGPDINKHDVLLWNDMLAAGGKPVISNEVTFLYRR